AGGSPAGSRPRPTNLRQPQTKIINCPFPAGRRGGLQAARAAVPCCGGVDGGASAFPFPVGRGLDPAAGFGLARKVPGRREVPRTAYTPLYKPAKIANTKDPLPITERRER